MAKLTLSTYWRSSCSYRVRIALGYKKLDWEPVYVDIASGQQNDAAYRAKNPIGHVPTLTIDGASYIESIAIMELLEELYPDPPLLPKKPEERARVRALVETINAGIQPLQNLIVLAKISDPSTAEGQEKRAEWLKFFIGRGLAAFEAQCSADGPYAFGKTFSIADACLVPQLYAARRYGVDLAPFPKLVRADAAASELPFVAAAKPEAQGDAKAS